MVSNMSTERTNEHILGVGAGAGAGAYLHVDLVSCISANHMVNGKPSTRVLVYPIVQSQEHVLIDDNKVAICHETLDIACGNQSIAVHIAPGRTELCCGGRFQHGRLLLRFEKPLEGLEGSK